MSSACMKKNLPIVVAAVLLLASCGSKSNSRAVKAEDLDKIMQEEAAGAPAGPARSILSAGELLELFNCNEAACVQMYMKERAADFVHAKKGEFASLTRGEVKDSAGNGLLMPFSTVYFSSEPGTDWRLAHTLHKKELSDELLAGFKNKGFILVDSFRYHATAARCYRYSSAQFPGLVLYHSPTFTPWYKKGLYLRPAWQSFVFEIHRLQ